VSKDAAPATTEVTGEALVLALSDAERRVTRRLARVLARHDCSVDRWRVIALLAGGQPHGMSELAEFTQLPPASATRLVDGLVADNMVHRKEDPRDRRRVLVHLTRRGQALQRELSYAIAAEHDEIFAATDESLLARLHEALSDLR
jgi:DNA-binding MarR family transcriptional regulator